MRLNDVLPLEDEAAYATANSVGEHGAVEFDAKREDAQARTFLQSRRGHRNSWRGLADNLRRLGGGDVQYVHVETAAYSGAVG